MEEKIEKRQKKNKTNDLSQSVVLQHITKLEPHNIDIPDYIDDFLKYLLMQFLLTFQIFNL